MRTRVFIGVSGVSLVALAAPASAQGQQTTPSTVKQDDQSKCVEEAIKSGQQANTCLKSENPILPATNELVWGSISFVILFFLLARFAYPAIKKGMEGRAEKIRNSIDEAENARGEAQQILEEYQRQLADARGEASRIIEEARLAADKLRQDLKRQAETEVLEMRNRAQEDIQAQVDRAMADLHARVAELSIELAEKVVERNIDRETNLALIENYINQVGATS